MAEQKHHNEARMNIKGNCQKREKIQQAVREHAGITREL